ncbi:MAG: hypothetical protein GDA36_07550 [Rhodobacteraceae bacterium]|nr:hypothetical protein [Paracoccaceae bacterium]
MSIPLQPAAKIRGRGKLPPARNLHRPDQRPLRDSVIFRGSFDWAILSGLLTLPGLTVGKAVLTVWLCDCRWLRVAGHHHAGAARLPPSPAGRLVLASPNYRAALHRGISSAQSRKRCLEISLPPAFFRSPQGSMTRD